MAENFFRFWTIIVVAICSHSVFGQHYSQSQGCLLQNGYRGQCKLLSECYGAQNLGTVTICSNSIKGYIICCPSNNANQNGQSHHHSQLNNPPTFTHTRPPASNSDFYTPNQSGTNPWLPPRVPVKQKPIQNPPHQKPKPTTSPAIDQIYFPSGNNPWLPPRVPSVKPIRGPKPPSDRIQNQNISRKKCEGFYSLATKSLKALAGQTFMITVVGGIKTKKGEFPYMAALGWESTTGEYDYNCGGSLVSEKFVVTAAHCASSSRGVKPTVVKLGGDNVEKTDEGVSAKIAKIYVHPNYRTNSAYNDIALIELEQPIQVTNYNPISLTPACLWQNPKISQQKSTAIGYGHTSFGGRRSNDLMKVTLNIFSNDDCKPYYQPGSQIEKGIQNTQLCAGDPDLKMDTCQGDSGGPILIYETEATTKIPYLIGVTSFGQGCAGTAPSIYTRMSSYIDWIESIVWSNERIS